MPNLIEQKIASLEAKADRMLAPIHEEFAEYWMQYVADTLQPGDQIICGNGTAVIKTAKGDSIHDEDDPTDEQKDLLEIASDLQYSKSAYVIGDFPMEIGIDKEGNAVDVSDWTHISKGTPTLGLLVEFSDNGIDPNDGEFRYEGYVPHPGNVSVNAGPCFVDNDTSYPVENPTWWRFV